MEVIKSLIEQRYALFNVNEKKEPLGYGENKLADWQNKTFDELKKYHNMKSDLWGMRMGVQDDGRYIMCLDFDICGKGNKNTGERVGCEYTKKKYEEYLSIVDKEDGHYLSSTIGNANVLIDYTDVAIIREQAEGITGKFKNHEFEVLVGSGAYQVIPPSNTICKINKQCVRARAFKNDKPFYILSEDSPINDFILNLLIENNKNKNNKKDVKQVIENEKQVIENNNTTEKIKEDKFTELLNDVIKNELKNGIQVIGWDDYFHIAGMLKTNNYDMDVFVQWAMLGGTLKQDAINKWKDIGDNKKLSIYGLQSIAKKVNEHFYKEWLMKHDTYISIKILEQGENNVAEYIKDQLSAKLVFCNNKWFVLNATSNLWTVVKIPYATIITHIQKKIDESRNITLTLKDRTDDENKKKEFDDFDKKYRAFYTKVTGGSYSTQITKLLQEYLLDGEFENKLDTIPYKVAYKNGIMDLKTLKFRYGLKSSDYLTRTIPFNYEESTNEQIENIKYQLLKICNMKPDHLDYYLSCLGYSLTGDASRIQEFYSLRGQTASNGKSIIFECLTKIIPNYVLKLESHILEETYGSRHKEYATWRGVRLAWINELSTKKQDENVIKDLADGTAVRYKVLYGEMNTMPVNLKLFIVSNNTLKIKADNGIQRRLKMMQLDSEFIDGIEDDLERCRFKKDTSFGLKLQTEDKHALLNLLYSYSKQFVDDNYQLKLYPNEWNNESKEVIKTNNTFHDFIEENFVFAPQFQIWKNQVEDILKLYTRSTVEFGTFRDELKAIYHKNFEYDCNRKQRPNRGLLFGLREKNEEDRKLEAKQEEDRIKAEAKEEEERVKSKGDKTEGDV